MFERHPNLSDDINNSIIESELNGGIWLATLAPNKILHVQTQNTLYKIKRNGELFYIQGNLKFCQNWTKTNIHGSTFGGSMLKVGFIGRGMYLEFSVDIHGTITTSQIIEITEHNV